MEKFELTPENLDKAAGMLKAIAHPVRISIIGCLEEGQKLTVTQIHKQLGLEQATTSHHLGILRDKGVLTSKREGKKHSLPASAVWDLKDPTLAACG